MSIDLKRRNLARFVSSARVALPPERVRAARARFCAIAPTPSALPARVYVYGTAARFDTLSIFQVVKHLYRDRPEVLQMLFPSKVILDSIRALEPEEELQLGSPAPAPASEKMALLEVFNAFRSCAPGAGMPYYYLPF